MCNQLSQFEIAKYVHLKDLLSKESCSELTTELRQLVSQQKTTQDNQCPISEAVHGAAAFDKLLIDLLPKFESILGKRLHPTYSYARYYKHGEKLKIHTDRPSCEISATITLGFDKDCWPIYMGDAEKTNAAEIVMDVGDAVLYKGMEKHHWRKKFKGQWQAQVFLHYVDADGPHKEWKWDKRKQLGEATKPELMFWKFDDIFTEEICDQICSAFSQETMPKQPPKIGGAVEARIDRSIRNVDRVILPTHRDLGGQLAAAGLSANNQAWKFDITHANQAEFLIYPAGGRYVSHVDTFLEHGEECRKLTVLAFLNDNFKGGRFFLQNGHERYYPPQNKGTVIVFPSFIMHGVEDVEDGERYSAVCWMVGKFFR
jgi:hypothetical protein